MSLNDMEISPNFTVNDWNNLNLSDQYGGDWDKASDVFKDRIDSRYIRPINELIKAHTNDKTLRVGFIVMTIDLIIIETLQGFIEGRIEHKKLTNAGKSVVISQDLVCSFLNTNPEFRDICDNYNVREFYQFVRCNLAHMGQTKGDIRIKAAGPIFKKEDDTIYINRTEFHNAVLSVFNRYCSNLKDRSYPRLRINFKNKMNSICGITV